MKMKQIFFFILISFSFCTCQEKNDTRCSIYDSECQKNFFQTLARKFAGIGLTEIGIPVIDPFQVSNITLSILGLLSLNFNGEAAGIGSTCIVKKFITNVEERYRNPEILCSKIVIRGTYKLISTPIVGKVCGWCEVSGEGNGTITLDDWLFEFKYPFKLLKRDNGKIYLNGEFDKATYKASVGNVVVQADCIKDGHRDITNKMVSFLNHNWRPIMNSYVGKFINDKSAEYYYEIYKKFFDAVPADQYFNDDNLASLVDN